MPIVKAREYSIYVNKEIFRSVSLFLSRKSYSRFFILCDNNTLKACLPLLIAGSPILREADIIDIESGEASKALEVCSHIWQTLIENKADKQTLLINLGGGVVSDLGGFVASVYKRGIDFINVPTSLLAMADASVGGKTGIDFNGVKNAVGSFAQPKAVFVYPGFLKTLPARHYLNGLAEVYKIALVCDQTFWKELRSGINSKALVKSILLKNDVVLRDPFDLGRRKILNFGHTIGHAIEALNLGTQEELLHGEAIVTGMIVESHLSFQKKLISKTVLQEVSAVLGSVFAFKSINHLPWDRILDKLDNDKKTTQGDLKFALITRIGACRIDVSANSNQVKKALSYYNQLVT